MAYSGRVVVYGGRGALGTKCVTIFKKKNFWVASIDLLPNGEADCNIIVSREKDLITQESEILKSAADKFMGAKLDAIICVAGGWIGGNAKKNFIKNTDLMLRTSLWPALISTSLAASYLKDGGILGLTGAKIALEPTPDMLSYGLAKSTVQHLTRSLACEGSGLPKGSMVVSVLPNILDTPRNRSNLPKGNLANWTPLNVVADMFLGWAEGKSRPKNGALVQLMTENYYTYVVPV